MDSIESLDLRRSLSYNPDMVQRLDIKIDTKAAAAIIHGASLIRNESGAWTLLLDLDGDIRVDDSRAIHVVAEVRVRGRQKGRAQKKREGK